MELKFEVKMKIQKPVAEVFDAVHDPEKLSAYFTTGGASAPLHEGTTVQWAFADNPGDEQNAFPVKVEKVIPEELIVIEWEGAPGRDTRVEFDFQLGDELETVVSISETGWQESQEDLDRSYMNCFGWGQFLCCLKAYCEYGINLRKGAFGGLYGGDGNTASTQTA
jgi:uncharacterized protein YndB with AHSA1/START domain